MEGYCVIKCKLTYVTDLLGSACNDPDLHGSYIASLAPDARSRKEEVEAVGIDEVIERGMTVFPRTKDNKPFIYDYHVKGFFKDSTAALKKIKGTKASKVKAYKKEIDGLVFVYPRQIMLKMAGAMGENQRMLRAATPIGERIGIAHSESAPAGTSVELDIECLTADMYELVRECLDYGIKRGMGQWRNAGWGRFKWEEVEVVDWDEYWDRAKSGGIAD